MGGLVAPVLSLMSASAGRIHFLDRSNEGKGHPKLSPEDQVALQSSCRPACKRLLTSRGFLERASTLAPFHEVSDSARGSEEAEKCPSRHEEHHCGRY